MSADSPGCSTPDLVNARRTSGGSPVQAQQAGAGRTQLLRGLRRGEHMAAHSPRIVAENRKGCGGVRCTKRHKTGLGVTWGGMSVD